MNNDLAKLKLQAEKDVLVNFDENESKILGYVFKYMQKVADMYEKKLKRGDWIVCDGCGEVKENASFWNTCKDCK